MHFIFERLDRKRFPENITTFTNKAAYFHIAKLPKVPKYDIFSVANRLHCSALLRRRLKRKKVRLREENYLQNKKPQNQGSKTVKNVLIRYRLFTRQIDFKRDQNVIEIINNTFLNCFGSASCEHRCCRFSSRCCYLRPTLSRFERSSKLVACCVLFSRSQRTE